MIKMSFHLQCDKCLKLFKTEPMTHTHPLIDEAKDAGWHIGVKPFGSIVVDGPDYCPNCQEKQKKPRTA